jgi:hypothetical protein
MLLSLDRGMIPIPILITGDGEITLIFHGKLKVMKILLNNSMDHTIKLLCSPTISFSSHHATLVLPTHNSN